MKTTHRSEILKPKLFCFHRQHGSGKARGRVLSPTVEAASQQKKKKKKMKAISGFRRLELCKSSNRKPARRF